MLVPASERLFASFGFFPLSHGNPVASNCHLFMVGIFSFQAKIVQFMPTVQQLWNRLRLSHSCRGWLGMQQPKSARLTLLRSLPINVCDVLVSRIQPLHFSKMESSDQSHSHGKYILPSNFLSSPAPGPIVQRIDFSKTSLPEYDGLYATIIDNALSEAECNALIRAAEAHAGGKWEQAMVNVGGGRQRLISDVRDCGRIIWDDDVVMGKIWSRISSLVPELGSIENAAHVTGYGPVKRGEKYQMTRLNERMRFLKYGSGQYFRRM